MYRCSRQPIGKIEETMRGRPAAALRGQYDSDDPTPLALTAQRCQRR